MGINERLKGRKKGWAFFEACQIYGSPKWRSTKAAGEKGQDLDWEVRVRVNHSNKSFWTEWEIIFLNDSCVGPYQNFITE